MLRWTNEPNDMICWPHRSDIRVPDYCYSEPPRPQGPVECGHGEMEDSTDVVLNAWIGPAHTVSPPHTDPHHNILAQLVGAKYIRLFPPWESDKLYRMGSAEQVSRSSGGNGNGNCTKDSTEVGDDDGDNNGGNDGNDDGASQRAKWDVDMSNTSQVDVGQYMWLFEGWKGWRRFDIDNDDYDYDDDYAAMGGTMDHAIDVNTNITTATATTMDTDTDTDTDVDDEMQTHMRQNFRRRFPHFHEAEYVEGVIAEGECVYIPRGWWHYVRSLEASVSVSFWWD